MAISKRIPDKYGFVFLLIENIPVTTSDALSNELPSWDDDVYVAAHYFPISKHVSYLQFLDFCSTAEGLSIQNAMIQIGVNIIVTKYLVFCQNRRNVDDKIMNNDLL